MKKFVAIFILLVGIMFNCCACDSEKSVVLFNSVPFSKETIFSQTNTNVFKPNQRIYFLITLPKEVETQMLLLQVVKMGSQDRLGYELVWGKRIKIRSEEVHYYTDYFVFNEKGSYIIKVYSRDNPTKILTTANFFIK